MAAISNSETGVIFHIILTALPLSQKKVATEKKSLKKVVMMTSINYGYTAIGFVNIHGNIT